MSEYVNVAVSVMFVIAILVLLFTSRTSISAGSKRMVLEGRLHGLVILSKATQLPGMDEEEGDWQPAWEKLKKYEWVTDYCDREIEKIKEELLQLHEEQEAVEKNHR